MYKGGKRRYLPYLLLLAFAALLILFLMSLAPLISALLALRPETPTLGGGFSLSRLADATTYSALALREASSLLRDASAGSLSPEKTKFVESLIAEAQSSLNNLTRSLENSGLPPNVKKEMEEKLRKYAVMNEVASGVSSAALDVDAIRKLVKDSISGGDAETLRRVSELIARLLERLDSLRASVESIRPGDLFSESHAETLRAAVEDIKRTEAELREWSKLAEVLSKYGDVYESCRALKQAVQKLAGAESAEDANKALSRALEIVARLLSEENKVAEFYEAANSLSPGRAGVFAPEASSVKSAAVSTKELEALQNVLKEVAELMSQGLPPQDALLKALKEVGESGELLEYLRSVLSSQGAGASLEPRERG